MVTRVSEFYLIYTFKFAVVFYLISIISCKNISDNPSEDKPLHQTTLPSDFIDFYKNFHQDSTYQLGHITFPIPGVLQDTSGLDSVITWTAQNWKLHRQIIPDDLWAVDFTIPMEGIVIEFVHAREGGFWMERRFARIDSAWMLIYYQGLRMGPDVRYEE